MWCCIYCYVAFCNELVQIKFIIMEESLNILVKKFQNRDDKANDMKKLISNSTEKMNKNIISKQSHVDVVLAVKIPTIMSLDPTL